MNMKQLKRSIEEVLQENFADLEEMFSNEDMLKQFSSRLYQKKIVTKTTKDKPTFNLVVKDFNNDMIFMKTENDFHDHCISFITSLQSLEGPALKAAEILKSEWNKAMKEKYNPKAQETNSAGVSSLVSPNPSTLSSVLRQNLQRCPFLNKIHTDIGDNLSNGNAGKSLKSIWLDEAQRNSKSTDEDIPYANEPQSESEKKSSTATIWSMNKGSHYEDSATQYPKTEQVIPHKDVEEQIRRHYTDPSYINKNDQRVPQVPHESLEQSEPPQHPNTLNTEDQVSNSHCTTREGLLRDTDPPSYIHSHQNVPHDTQHSQKIASSGKDDSPDKSEPIAATLSTTNDSRNPFQATDVSETHEKLLVLNGSTIPRSHSFNKLKTHLKVQTSIKEVERNKTSGKDYTVIIEMCTYY